MWTLGAFCAFGQCTGGWLSQRSEICILTVLLSSFDQARLIRHNQILAANGIDPSGQPHLPSNPPLLIHTYLPRTRDAHGRESDHPPMTGLAFFGSNSNPSSQSPAVGVVPSSESPIQEQLHPCFPLACFLPPRRCICIVTTQSLFVLLFSYPRLLSVVY